MQGELAREAVVLLISGRPERGTSLAPKLGEGSGGRLVLAVAGDLQEGVSRAAQAVAAVVLLELPEEKEQRRRMVRVLISDRAFPSLPMVVIDTRPGTDELVRRQLFAAGAVDYLSGWPDTAELVSRLLAHARGPLAERERDRMRMQLERGRAELRDARSDLSRATTLDSVTGLPGADRLDEFLEAEWRRARRNGSALSVVLLELRADPADMEGMMRALALPLRGTLHRGGDLLASVRPGRFAAVLPETGAEGASVVSRSLLRAARNIRPGIGFRVGVASARPKDPASVSPGSLLAEAEAAFIRHLEG